MSRLRHNARPALLLIAILIPVVAACSGGTSGTTSAASTSTPSPTATASASPAPVLTAQPARLVRDVPYASRSPAQRLDLYLPDNRPAGHPVLVFVHGGAWLTGDKAGPIAQAIIPVALAHGYAVASVNYRLSGEARFPAQVHDLKAALRWLRAHASSYALDPARMAAFGESAGAHTVALAVTTQGTTALDDLSLGNATTPSTVSAAVLWYPPVDLLASHAWLTSTPQCAGKVNDPDAATSPESRLLGAAVQSVPDRARAANPVTYVAKGRALPQVLIEHGDQDCTAPLQGSQELYDALVKAGGAEAAKLIVVKGSGHYLAFDALAAAPAALEFLEQKIG